MLFESQRENARLICISNLLTAQKNMASSERIDAKGIIKLTRFLLRLLEQTDDKLIQLIPETPYIKQPESEVKR